MAVRPGYRWHVGQLTTGEIFKTVEVSSGTWSKSFDYAVAGKVDFSVPLKAIAENEMPEWLTPRSDTAPPKAFAAVSYVDESENETFIEAGPIWKRTYSKRTGILSIGASGLSTYFDHRKAIDRFTSDAWAEWEAEYTAHHLSLIAKRYIELVQYTAVETGFAEGPTTEWMSLPIVLPSDADLGGASPADHYRALQGYELAWLGTRLRQLTEVIDGPEIQFVPRRRSDAPDFIEWVARIGVAENDFMLTQTGDPWIFDTSVEESPVRDLEIDEDAIGFAHDVWAAGEGEAQAKPIAVGMNAEGDALLENGYPLLDGEVTDTDSVSILATLQSHVDAGAKRASRPLEQWTLTVSRDGPLHIGRLSPGDWAEVRIGSDDPYISEGHYPGRLLSMAGGTSSDEIDTVFSERMSEV
jgi:hypothetical protein